MQGVKKSKVSWSSLKGTQLPAAKGIKLLAMQLRTRESQKQAALVRLKKMNK